MSLLRKAIDMLTIDTREIDAVERELRRLPHNIFRTEVAQKALYKAAEPTLMVMSANTPRGSKVYVPKTGRGAGDITYARGGYLKQSIRKKNTNFRKFGEVQVLVGYSKKKGKAGWRAHFTDQGYTHYQSKRFIKGKNWMKPAEQSTIGIVEERFVLEIQREVDKTLGGL